MAFTNLQNFLEHYTATTGRGTACVVYRGEDKVFESCNGYMDEKQQKKVHTKTIFRLYSNSKFITCAAMMKLVEEGRCRLDDPVSQYLPEYMELKVVDHDHLGVERVRGAKNVLTIRHLFTMTSGFIYDYEGSVSERVFQSIKDEHEEAIRNHTMTTRDIIREVQRIPLMFEPGTRWMYGLSHNILGALIEVITGKRLSAYLRELFWEPLGMEDTGFYIPKENAHNIFDYKLKYYSDKLFIDEMDRWTDERVAIEMGSSGILSTLEDYGRFACMLTNCGAWEDQRIMNRRTVKLMASNQLNTTQMQDFAQANKPGYGYGLGVRTMMDPARAGRLSNVGEFGWDGMLGTFALCDPVDGVTIVFLQQSEEQGIFDIHDNIVNAAYSALD